MIREELALDIWPDAERSVRLGNLRPALTYARQALGAQSALSQDGEMIALSLDVQSDWEEAELLEGNAQAALGDDHLVALFSLHEALRKPLSERVGIRVDRTFPHILLPASGGCAAPNRRGVRFERRLA